MSRYIESPTDCFSIRRPHGRFNLFLYYDDKQQIRVTIRMQERTESWLAILLVETVRSAGIIIKTREKSPPISYFRNGRDARWEIKSLDSAGRAYADSDLHALYTQDALNSLVFLELLEKVVLALTCHRHLIQLQNHLSWIGLPFFILYSVFGRSAETTWASSWTITNAMRRGDKNDGNA